MDWIRTFFEVFLPLLVAIDPFGLIPVYLGVTADRTPEQRRRIGYQACSTALAITVGFMFLGAALFGFLGIDANDFMIGGGLILLVFAIRDLLLPSRLSVQDREGISTVPLATPLIAGPATLTTTLVLTTNPRYGYGWTGLSLAVNFAILLVALLASDRVAALIGKNSLRAFSKLVMVLLAAIAVNFIRRGMVQVFATLPT